MDERFLNRFTEEIAPRMARLGVSVVEKDLVQDYFDKLDINNKGRDIPSNKKEYEPLRDEALESEYGKEFKDQYVQNKILGQGAVGSVFEKPEDSSRALKVFRTTEDTGMFGDIGITEKSRAEDEVEAQLQAAEAGVAPRLHTVETYPVAKRKLRDNTGLPNESKFDEIMQIMEMDKVSTVDDEGGIDEIIDKKLKNFGFDNQKNYPYKGTKEQKGEFMRRKDEMTQAEDGKYKLALSKTRLKLADKGLVHNDLGSTPEGDRRPDHLSYDPYSNEMKFVDFNEMEAFNHSNNLHEHTRNMNLKNEELKDYTPGANVEHFLDHKVNAILQGMNAVGNTEEANMFKGLYEETVDSGDLFAANDLVNQGREIIDKHTAKDVDNKYLEFLKKRK